MPYEFTPLAVPYAVAALVTGALWLRLWSRRSQRAARAFLLDVSGVVLLSTVVALKVSATDLATKLFWWNWRFLAVSCMAVGYMLMAAEYTDTDAVRDRRLVAGLAGVALLTTAAAWTNGTDGPLYAVDGLTGGLLVPSFGPLYWAYAAVMVGCIAVGVSLLVRVVRSRVGLGRQVAVLVGSIALVMAGVVLWWLRVVPLDTLALTSTVKVVGFYLAVDRFGLLETLPVARATVLETMEDAVFVLGETGQVVDMNPAAATLIEGRPGSDPAVDEVLGVDLSAELAAAGPPTGESEVLTRQEVAVEHGGETRYYDLTLSLFPEGGGGVVVLRDITDRRSREQEITVLNRIVRHDIRNEMNVLHGRAQLLEDYLEPGGEEHHRLVVESAQHVIGITDTVGELMDTIVAGDDMVVKPVALAPLLESEVAKARSNFPEATFRLGDVPAVSVRANEMLSSVFTNLLNNAVVHNRGTDPWVDVDVAIADGTARIRVADNGPGVPPDRRDEVFGRGEKGLDSEGTGVGLYLVDTLTDEFGGHVRIGDSEAGGAAFVVKLPLAEVAAEATVSDPATETKGDIPAATEEPGTADSTPTDASSGDG